MTALPESGRNLNVPNGVTVENPPFVPRMVLTKELQIVMRDVMEQWRNRAAFEPLLKFGIRPLDRLLFYGPPGNGKTMACYWMARELGVQVYRVLCNQLHSSYVAETTRNVANVMDFFNSRKAPTICLWDEVEAIFIDRRKSDSAASHEYAAALTVFMQTLDRWKSPTLIVMATNLPSKLDEALLSRVELKLEFVGPNEEQCGQVIQYWRELLHEHGADEWGPRILDRIMTGDLPASFRDLQQTIAYAARDWVAQRCKKS